MVIDEGFADFGDFEDLRLSDLSALGDLSNVSSTRHWFLASWLTTKRRKIGIKSEQTGSGHTLNRVPPQSPKKKMFFSLGSWGTRAYVR